MFSMILKEKLHFYQSMQRGQCSWLENIAGEKIAQLITNNKL